MFCCVAKAAEQLATSFFPPRPASAIEPKEDIFALPDEIFTPGTSLPRFRALTEEEAAALETYRAPKQFV